MTRLAAQPTGAEYATFREAPWAPAGAFLLAASAGALSVPLGPVVAVALAGAAAVATLALAPRAGAYAYLLVTPLIVGVARGGAFGPLRPNEALLLVLVAGLAARILLLRRCELPRWTRIDIALLLLVLAGSCAPMLMRVARGLPLAEDDILYALVLPKYAIVFFFFRLAIKTVNEVEVCLRITICSAALVAIIGILQVRDLFEVPILLATYYDQPFTGTWEPVVQRATSTVASSFGVADLMAMALAIVAGWLATRRQRPLYLLPLAAVCLLGAFASGQFTGFIGLLVALVAVGLVTRRLHRLMMVLWPLGLMALFVVWPVIQYRIQGFSGTPPLPQSWLGRIDNLHRFIFPELLREDNWIWGVRPAARLLAPEAWREFIFIESGYIWLLWTGGVPLLLAFAYFITVTLRTLAKRLRGRRDAVRVAAAAAFGSVTMLTVLMLFDPHLTMRGGADLLFPLIALALVGDRLDVNGAGLSTSSGRRGACQRRLGSVEFLKRVTP